LALDPELVLDLFDDPTSAGEQLARIRDTLDVQLRERREAGRPITDVLVYYIGHGQQDDDGQLSLLVRKSRRNLETETGIKARDLARTLRLAAPQQRRSVVLDCCFSEAAASAFMGMAGDLNQQVAAIAAKDLADDQPNRGTLVLCSSPKGQISIGPPKAERTLFTGAVLEVLQQGAHGRSQFLSFADLRDAAFERMVVNFGAFAPRPVLHQVNAADGDLTRAPAFPNRYRLPKGTEEARQDEEVQAAEKACREQQAGRDAEEARRQEQAREEAAEASRAEQARETTEKARLRKQWQYEADEARRERQESEKTRLKDQARAIEQSVAPEQEQHEPEETKRSKAGAKQTGPTGIGAMFFASIFMGAIVGGIALVVSTYVFHRADNYTISFSAFAITSIIAFFSVLEEEKKKRK
jgi:hypothetical protein